MKKIGFIGWRGMVGSVLMQRMIQENDFNKITPYFFSTSSAGKNIFVNNKNYTLLNANEVADLKNMDIIISTQGGEYTKKIYPKLKSSNWNGYWIDAASTLRMENDSFIILDPVNADNIKKAIHNGIKTFVGGNCSITLAMIGLAGLLKQDLIEWMNIITFQAASGAGAKHVKEFLLQNSIFANKMSNNLLNSNLTVLDLIQKADDILKSNTFPVDNFGIPLINNIIPWIDSDLGNGSSKEEWKGEVELNKILSFPESKVKVDGFCVRVGAIRCHSTAITMKLKKDLTIQQVEEIIKTDNQWINFVNNTKVDTLNAFSPISVSGTLQVNVGRLKKMSLEKNLFGVMTIGDQLLWGAAEPLRRVLNMLI